MKTPKIALSDVLYTLDPAHTCCVENECADEYDGIAEVILNRFEPPMLFSAVVKDVFCEYFDIELDNDTAINIYNCYIHYVKE